MKAYSFLTSLLVLGAAQAANAAIMPIADPGGTLTEIGARIRWGGTGFEASIWDVDGNVSAGNQIHQNPTLNPFGTPVWLPVSGAPHKFQVTFSSVTGTLGLDVDFDRSGTTPGRSSLGSLVINGTSLASMTPGGLFLENFYKDSSGNLLTSVVITGELDFIVAGTSQERPSWNFNFKNAELPPLPPLGGSTVPEPASLVLWSLLGLAAGGIGMRRRKEAAV